MTALCNELISLKTGIVGWFLIFAVLWGMDPQKFEWGERGGGVSSLTTLCAPMVFEQCQAW